MPDPAEARQQKIIRHRLREMGLETRLLPGARSVLAVLPLGPEPFEGLRRSYRLRSVTFATVGPERAKCLSPRPLFHLPCFRLADCGERRALESRIRSTWSARLRELSRAAMWLERLGAPAEPDAAAPLLHFPILVDGAESRAGAIEPRRVILPSCGPLRGLALERPQDRVLAAGAACGSSLDLELAVTTRIEELARLEARRARQRRLAAAPASGAALPRCRERAPSVLLVGPRLRSDTPLIESLRLRGYRVESVRTPDDAVRAFGRASYELVLADARAGRSDGLELIPSLRALEGVEDVPVVLVDDRGRAERREAARRAGAAGYLVHPIDPERVERGFQRLVRSPRRRRYTRYPQRLSVRWRAAWRPAVTSTIGRGGLLFWTEHESLIRPVDRYEILLPELGESLRADAATVYRLRGVGSSRTGVGLRFLGFPDGNESLLIECLRELDPRRA